MLDKYYYLHYTFIIRITSAAERFRLERGSPQIAHSLAPALYRSRKMYLNNNCLLLA